LIEAEFGLKVFAIVVKLLQKIYGMDGYYCEWNDEVSLMFACEIGAGVNDVSEIVEAAIRRGLFDKTIYDKYHVLTSSGIQERYLNATGRRQKIVLFKEYLLFDVDKNKKNVCIKAKNARKKQKNDDENFAKENNSKGKKIKDIDPALLAGHTFSEAVEIIICDLNKKAKKNFKAETANTRKLIKDRFLDGYALENFLKVIDTMTWNGTAQFSKRARLVRRILQQKTTCSHQHCSPQKTLRAI
jgi:uncharacterized phage protein (TIGR02220 family)